ncbi:MAG TPA: hypothetical protein VLM85_07910 [Polyangiaceae bacterium]|nr:hypothetical protein [Polyangiaceae bacterium]
MRAREPASDGGARPSCLFAEARALFEGGELALYEGDVAVEAASLSLAEFHALRAIATRLGWLDEETIEIECRNCEAAIEARPCESLPLGPFVDAELIDPEIDVTLDTGDAHPIEPIRLPKGGRAATVRLGPVTLGQALPLHRALAKPALRVTPSVVRAMGVRALGDERDPAAIARALARCTDAQFGAVTDLFLAAHYPPRLAAPIVCPSCGSRNDVDAPYDREFEPEGVLEGEAPRRGEADEAFPSLDAFDAFAREVAEPLLDRAPGPEIALVIDGDVPACDDGGEPLMGSYTPGHEGDSHGPTRSPELTLYYRTFAAMWREDGPYDWEGEVRDTIEHELEHHVYALEGHDPKDEEERDEIAREAERVVGKKALVRAGASAFAADLRDFWKRTWILWIVGLIVVVISVLASR